MNTYLDQTARQEFTRQHFERISLASAMASAVRRPGVLNLSDLDSNKLTVRSKSRLVLSRFNHSLLPWFNRSLPHWFKSSAVEPKP